MVLANNYIVMVAYIMETGLTIKKKDLDTILFQIKI